MPSQQRLTHLVNELQARNALPDSTTIDCGEFLPAALALMNMLDGQPLLEESGVRKFISDACILFLMHGHHVVELTSVPSDFDLVVLED